MCYTAVTTASYFVSLEYGASLDMCPADAETSQRGGWRDNSCGETLGTPNNAPNRAVVLLRRGVLCVLSPVHKARPPTPLNRVWRVVKLPRFLLWGEFYGLFWYFAIHNSAHNEAISTKLGI